MKARADKKSDAVGIALSYLSEKLGKTFVTVVDRQYNMLSVLVKGEGMSEEELGSCRDAIAHALDTKGVMLKIADIEESEASKYIGNNSEAPAVTEMNCEFKNTAENDRNDDTKKKIDELVSRVQNLIGADEFKKLVDDILHISEFYTDQKMLCKILCAMSYLISVNRGTGRNLLPVILAELTSLLVGYENKPRVFEYNVTDKKLYDGTLEIKNVLRSIDTDAPDDVLYVHVLHIDQMLNKFNSTSWLALMDAVENNSKNRMYIFTVSYLEDIVLSDIHNKINDNISNKIVRIPPFTNDMYIEAFRRAFAKYDMTLSVDAHDAIVKKIAEEKSDGNFRGINTVKKIVSEVLYYKAQKSGSIPNTVTADDIEILLAEKVHQDVSGFDKLDSLVSLDNVKEKVREILATIKLKKSMGDTRALSMHMMFSGCPGTGKTVVARLIGQIFKEEHILTKGDFYEVTRKDLVGEYVGQTAPKTAEVCKAAYGSVLFIDEAYSLAGAGENDYGREAISTLIAEMENNRNNMVVIFAGYENELLQLFDMNPGLRDRIPYRISFENYSRDELAQIFYKSIPATFAYDDDFMAAADKFFESISDEILGDRNFSNGRFVRNLVERVISKSALRMMMDSGAEKGRLTKSDFLSAISDSDFAQLNKKTVEKKKIGF